MGWVWKDDDEEEENTSSSSSTSSALGIRGNEKNDLQNPNPNFSYKNSSSTQKVVRSQCKTEQVEPGKFVRKCERTEEIFKSCGAGKPLELVESNTEYTEDDVTNEMTGGGSSFSMFSSEDKPFNFPGLRSDMEAIEKSLSGGLGHFLDAAEEMKKGIFEAFGAPFEKEFPSPFRRGIPIKEGPSKEFSNPQKNDESAFSDLGQQTGWHVGRRLLFKEIACDLVFVAASLQWFDSEVKTAGLGLHSSDETAVFYPFLRRTVLLAAKNYKSKPHDSINNSEIQ